MPKVKDTYYDNVERIKERFPEKELLNKREVADFLGCKYQYVHNNFPFVNNRITVATLARCLAV